MIRIIRTIGLVVYTTAIGVCVQANDELALSYGDMEMVSIATGNPLQINKAPSVVSVITSEDIRTLGARDLHEVLRTVPGLHVTNNYARAPKYVFRGIYSDGNSEALLLINGVPVRNLINGNHFYLWGGMPLNAIAKIEVIRGPGSALYGADAFAGVINIWTKQASDIDGVETGVRVGSDNTTDAWLQYGGTTGGFDVAASLEWFSSDGNDEIISRDAQTTLDAGVGTSASAAPGPASNSIDGLELRFDVVRGAWQFRVGYQERGNMGMGTGALEAIDNLSSVEHKRYNTDINFNKVLREGLRLEMQASYYQVEQQFSEDNRFYPPGATFIGTFPDGVIGTPEWKQHSARASVSVHYSSFEHHNMLLSTGIESAKMDEVSERRNYELIEVAPGMILPAYLGEIITVQGDDAFVPEERRENYYLILQDEWRFADDWQLIAGIRGDHYTDFGTTTTPRLALIWDTSFNLTSKLLYGKAFRAPSFNELYAKELPTLGNTELSPQTIETYELAFNYQPSVTLNLDLNFFSHFIDDMIVYQNTVAANVGEIEGYGAELAFDYTGINQLTLSGNYAYQVNEDQMTGMDVGYAPNHEVFISADWQMTDALNLVNDVQWVGNRKRSSGDQRSAIDGYTRWDLLLHWRALNNQLDSSVGIYNVLDSDIRDPSQAKGVTDTNGLLQVNIPDDIPQLRRNYAVRLSYKF